MARDDSASELASGLRRRVATEDEPATLHAEWDYLIRRERPAFCSVKERPGRAR